MPTVSVVIPTYNMADFLPQAIESALNEAGPEVEVIVVDDGSTDDTESAVRPYLSRVRYYRQRNQGVRVSRNQGVKMTSGELIRFLDADDLLAPGSLTKQVEMLARYPHAALVWGQAYVMDRGGEVYGVRKATPPRSKTALVPSMPAFRWLLRGNTICNSTVMVRRSALPRLAPPDCGPSRGEDWEMWLRLSAHYDLAYIPAPLAYYRTHPESLTSRTTVELFRDSHVQTIESLFADPGFPHRRLEGLAHACVQRSVALTAARCRERRLFARHFLSALGRRPGLLLEAYTWYCLYEACKSATPLPLLQQARRLKRALTGRWRPPGGPGAPAGGELAVRAAAGLPMEPPQPPRS